MEKDNLELYEEREHEILEELGRMKFDDPNRKPLMAELSSIAAIRNNYDQTELTRLSNNAKNDIEEEKIKIENARVELEEKKVKLDNGRMWIGVGQFILGATLGTFCQFKSYKMEEKGYAYKDLKEFGKKVTESVTGLFSQFRKR